MVPYKPHLGRGRHCIASRRKEGGARGPKSAILLLKKRDKNGVYEKRLQTGEEILWEKRENNKEKRGEPTAMGSGEDSNSTAKGSYRRCGTGPN